MFNSTSMIINNLEFCHLFKIIILTVCVSDGKLRVAVTPEHVTFKYIKMSGFVFF